MAHFESVTIVTGAAGGVGGAVVRALVARGGAVVAEDISPAVRDLESDAVAVVVGDVAESATAEAAVGLAVERFGRLDGLVNNAARFHTSPIGEIEPELWDAVMRTNARGAFVHLKAAEDALAASKGAVVNVSSISGLVGLPNQLLYGATKGAITEMTRMAAIELAPKGIRVNAVAPGAIETGFMDDFLPPDAEVKAGIFVEIAASHPIGRSSTSDEVADAIVYLLTTPATITGVILPVDGGFTAR